MAPQLTGDAGCDPRESGGCCRRSVRSAHTAVHDNWQLECGGGLVGGDLRRFGRSGRCRRMEC
eukprot:469054-Prorocentrum_lima.AAC.1